MKSIELEYQQIGKKKALMAFVMNQGIKAVSGNIVFYDANGSSVAECAFTKRKFSYLTTI